MSWKSLVTTGLLCIIASPVFAANPTLTITNAPALDPATGEYIWTVAITPTTGTSPAAAELGFRETVTGAQINSATTGSLFDGTNTQNPGTQIFTWETTDPGANGKPVGLQTNLTLDEIFASMGSEADLPAGASTYLTIRSDGPTSSRLTTSLEVLGKYGTGSNKGRIAEITSGTNATNYDVYAGVATRTVQDGDVNLSGTANASDFLIIQNNLNKNTGQHWGTGDLNGSGTTNASDFLILQNNLNKSGGSNPGLTISAPGAGGGSSLGAGSVPEPASIVLCGLAVLAGLGLIRRR